MRRLGNGCVEFDSTIRGYVEDETAVFLENVRETDRMSEPIGPFWNRRRYNLETQSREDLHLQIKGIFFVAFPHPNENTHLGAAMRHILGFALIVAGAYMRLDFIYYVQK